MEACPGLCASVTVLICMRALVSPFAKNATGAVGIPAVLASVGTGLVVIPWAVGQRQAPGQKLGLGQRKERRAAAEG